MAALLVLVGGIAWVRLQTSPAGPVLQSVPLGQLPAAVAVDARTERVFVVPASGSTGTMLDARSGTVLAMVPAHGQAVAVDERAGTVFVPDDRSVALLDAVSGRLVRSVAIATFPGAIAVDDRAGHAFVVDPGSDHVAMLDARSGAILHAVAVVLPPRVVAVDARASRAFVAGDAPFVTVLDTRSGAPVRSFAIGVTPIQMAVDARAGHAFVVGSQSSGVTVFDTRNGMALRTVAVALDPPRQRAFVLARNAASRFGDTAGGSVVVLDERSGAVRRTIPVPAAVFPSAFALDARSQRLFVASQGGVVAEPDRWGWLPAGLRRWLPFLPAAPAQGLHYWRIVPPSLTILDVSHE